jgi:hypothetical protein
MKGPCKTKGNQQFLAAPSIRTGCVLQESSVKKILSIKWLHLASAVEM